MTVETPSPPVLGKENALTADVALSLAFPLSWAETPVFLGADSDYRGGMEANVKTFFAQSVLVDDPDSVD